MLTRLVVSNLALIERIELMPCSQLNILSGETGAGKSIIVDGLMLLLGSRYDKSLLRYGASSGFVEGEFEVNARAREVFGEFGWDEDECIIINRKFNSDGRNEIRINGRAATINMLRQLTSALVDIYGQNEYQSLTRPSEHFAILDYYVHGEIAEVKAEYVKLYAQYRETKAALLGIGDAGEREREIDLLRFQLDEIANSGVYENEEDELIEKRNIITSAEKIYAALGAAAEVLGEQEDGAANELIDSALKSIGSVSDIKNTYSELYERLQSLSIELNDVYEGVRDELDSLSFDADELEETEKRLALVRSIKRKYGSYSDMLAFKKKAEDRLAFLENADENFAELTRKKEKLTEKLYKLGKTMHDKRVSGAAKFESKIKKELSELGMENSDFKIEIPEYPNISEFEKKFGMSGADSAEFYLSPNAGQPLKPLIKIISGGEMSRFMLALKVISNEIEGTPTMIFDEIDAGISGITGQVVAKKLAAISRKHQILCVSHLPQIASMADAHFYISKHTAGDSTVTTVTQLDYEGMVSEVSRLSGGKGISDKSDSNALVMKQWSDDYKASL